MNYKHYKHLPPFKGMVLQNFPFIEEDFDAITNYQLLCKVVEYLKNVIANELTMEENITNLYSSFTELKNYVDNYFANLDVQEEINNKLDEMAESGELAEIINSYDILKIIAGKFNANETSSNYTILSNQNKNVLIDASYSNNWANVKEMLDTYGITHLDCFILTHYDNDHKGNFANGNLMIDGYIDSETILYLPTEDNSVSESEIETIKALCEEYNLTYNTPYEGEEYNFGSTTIKFTNCDVSQKNAYYSPETRANIYNTVCIVTHKTDKLLFMADGDNQTFDLMNINGVIDGTIDFITIPHHGYNSTTNADYLRQLSPYIALQEAGISDFARSAFTACPSMTQLINQGCKIVSTFIQTDYIEIDSTGFGVQINKGKIFDTSNYLMQERDIYVDIMTDNTSIQLGTEENPFKELNQALSTIKNYQENVIRIHLADGTYNTNLGDIPTNYLRATNLIQNFGRTIVIEGNNSDNTKVTIKGINTRNVSNLIIKDLTISNQYRHGLELYNTNCYIENCIITNPNESLSYDGIYLNDGSVFINESSILYADSVLNCVNGTIRARDLTVNDFNNLYPATTRGTYIITTITFSDTTKQYDKVNMYKDYKGLRQIYTNESTSNIGSDDTEVELPLTIQGLKNLKIGLTTSGGHRIIVDARYPNSSNDVPFNYVSGSNQYYYIISGLLQFEDNKLKIANQQQIRVTKSDGTLQVSTWGSFYHFRIFSVWVDDNY